MTGLIFLTMAALAAASGLSSTHFYGSPILLGVGWNFGFIGVTTDPCRAHDEFILAATAQNLKKLAKLAPDPIQAKAAA